MSITVGGVAYLGWTVVNQDGTAVDASTVALVITLPDGTTVTPEVDNPPAETGVYALDYTTSQAGWHSWKATMTSPTAVVEGSFHVEAAGAPGVLSLAEARDHLNLSATTHDEELADWIRAVTGLVEHHVGPVARRQISGEWHPGGPVLWLRHTPVISVDAVEPAHGAGPSYDSADLLLDGQTGRVTRAGGGGLYGGPYTVTYTAGRTVIPANVRAAARIILKHLWDTQRGPTGTPLQPLDEAGMVPGLAYAVPHRALELLEQHRRGALIA